MSLEMRTRCEKCSNELNNESKAYICSYECTFCPSCSEKMEYICPNCGGELVTRPKRIKNSVL